MKQRNSQMLPIRINGTWRDDPQFAGAGPIDCMYVLGRQAGDSTLGKKSTETFGPDHFAVFTRFLFSGTAPKLAARWPRSSEKKIGVRISALLPNREGRDEGNEWLTLKNGAKEPVDLAGWQLPDEAGHTVRLNGVLAPKAELKVRLEARQMPLNNNGDDIELLDAQGQVVDKVSYVAGQVSPGARDSIPSVIAAVAQVSPGPSGGRQRKALDSGRIRASNRL